MKTNCFPPALIVYTDRLPEYSGAAANGPVVRVRPKYRDDKGIHRHELRHVEQWWIGVALGFFAGLLLATLGAGGEVVLLGLAAGIAVHPVAYLRLRRYRLWTEARAYREQTRWPAADGDHLSVESAAYKLTAEHYRLGLTYEQALAYLKGHHDA